MAKVGAVILTTFDERPDYPQHRLVARDLGCVRGGRPVFEGLSFALRAGEMLTLRGPNGSGKSSLLRQIAGLLDVSHGELVLEGGGGSGSPGDAALYVGHLDAVKAPLTVEENLLFWADFYDVDRARVSLALAGLGLAPLAMLPAGILSAGQKKRLGLARVLLIDRPLWLLDEPTVSLDAANVTVLAGLMTAHMARGGLIVAASHVELGIETAKRLELGQAGRSDKTPVMDGAL